MTRGAWVAARVLPVVVALGLASCATEAPSLAPFGDVDLSGTWQFSWLLEDSCRIEVDFEIVQARTGYFQGTQSGAPSALCLPEWPAELSRGTLLGQVSDDGALWFRGRWKEAETYLEASARLAVTQGDRVDGDGFWDVYAIGEWWEDPWSLAGEFTASRLPAP